MSNGENNDGMFFWCAVLVIIFLFVPVWYAAHSGSINGFLLDLAKGELKLFTGVSDEASIALERIEAAKPEDLPWATVEKVLSYAGSWIRWPYLIFLGLLAILSLNLGRIGKFTRRLNMETLLRNNAESFPCLRPVVGRGKYLLSKDSFDSGNWRIARTPLQFALEQGLLLDMAGNPAQLENVLRDGLPQTVSYLPNTPTIPKFLVFSYIYRKIPDGSTPEYGDYSSAVAYPKTYPYLSSSSNLIKLYHIVVSENLFQKKFLIFWKNLLFLCLFWLLKPSFCKSTQQWQFHLCLPPQSLKSRRASNKFSNRSPPQNG